MAKVVGIDIGTSSICALFLDTDRPERPQVARVQNDAWILDADPRARQQEPDLIWSK